MLENKNKQSFVKNNIWIEPVHCMRPQKESKKTKQKQPLPDKCKDESYTGRWHVWIVMNTDIML